MNENCQVLGYATGLEMAPIEGLYAGGRMLPYDYHMGFAISDAFSCGRVAARHAAGL